MLSLWTFDYCYYLFHYRTRACVFQVVYSIWLWFVLGNSFEDSDGGCLLDFIFQFIPFPYTVWQQALAHLFCGSSQLGQVIDSASCVRIPFTQSLDHPSV